MNVESPVIDHRPLPATVPDTFPFAAVIVPAADNVCTFVAPAVTLSAVFAVVAPLAVSDSATFVPLVAFVPFLIL